MITMPRSAETDKVESVEFKWGKKRGIGGKKKEVQFYDSFMYDGVEYTLYDCIYMYKEGEPEPYIGKLIKIWADKTKKVKVQWFFRPSEILNWLGDEEPLENEIFLASGEGVGLANVNSLEAIAGKCNVVCTSKDSRNPQPSLEELQLADYIFYRTFDVGQCKILDTIADKVAGVEVKFIFNKECETTSSVRKLDSDKKADDENTVACKEKVQISEKNPSHEFKTPNIDGNSCSLVVKEDTDVKDSLVKRKATSGVEKGSVSNDKSSARYIIGANENELKMEEKVKSAKDSGALEDRPSKKARVNSSAKESDDKNLNSDKMLTVQRNDGKASIKSVIPTEEKTKSGSVKDLLGQNKSVKSPKDSGSLEDGPFKKPRVDSSTKLPDNKNKSSVHKLSINSDGNDAKTKSKLAKHSIGREPEPEPEPDEKIAKLSNGKLLKAPSRKFSDEDIRSEHREIEVTRRPDTDKRKWFRELPWVERIASAHENGTLVLFQNLDPNYTSDEVEDVIWHGFKESCSIKMVQRTAISSPHSGQAFGIFKTKEAAERVVRKLDEGCLMLTNGRPLLGSISPPPSLSGKHSTFFGHLSIDKAKLLMQREMKEAVSTSHYSQHNTIEFEMAMEWRLLQARSESWWKRLYKQQGEELRKLKANLKKK